MRKKRNTTDMKTENYSGKHRIVKNIILAVFCILFAVGILMECILHGKN